jgi:hypothetical protein
MIISYMAVMFHQFEEYGWPGGFPAIYNIVFRPDGDRPDRCPLNRQSVVVTNVFVAWEHYVLPIIFPSVIWLGFAPVLFGMAQIVFHGVMVNKKMHSIYNPGVFSVVFLHWPLGIYYICYVVTHGLAFVGTGITSGSCGPSSQSRGLCSVTSRRSKSFCSSTSRL